MQEPPAGARDPEGTGGNPCGLDDRAKGAETPERVNCKSCSDDLWEEGEWLRGGDQHNRNPDGNEQRHPQHGTCGQKHCAPRGSRGAEPVWVESGCHGRSLPSREGADIASSTH